MEGTTFTVTFVEAEGSTTQMRGRGAVVVDAHGVRIVGKRPRIDAAFYGACTIAVASAGLAFWIVSMIAGRQVLSSIMGARPLLFGAGVFALGVLTVAHAFLIRLLPLAREDRRVVFSQGMTVDGIGDAVEITSATRGFSGATRFTVDGGSAERTRLLDEVATARSGGAASYRARTTSS